MSPFTIISLYASTTLLGYLFSVSTLTGFLAQLIALISIAFLVSLYFHHQLSPFFISLLVNVLVFATGGLHSPLFFLTYFLLFVIAFQHPPQITIAYTLILVFFLSQSLNSLVSLVPLTSLLFISPLAWFISRQTISNAQLNNNLANNQTDIYLWLSLRLKSTISQIIDSVSLILSDPRLPHQHHQELEKINHLSRHLLKSSQDLSKSIDNNSNES